MPDHWCCITLSSRPRAGWRSRARSFWVVEQKESSTGWYSFLCHDQNERTSRIANETLIGRPQAENMILFSYSGGGRVGLHRNETKRLTHRGTVENGGLAILTTGSEGGARVSGYVGRLEEVHPIPLHSLHYISTIVCVAKERESYGSSEKIYTRKTNKRTLKISK